MSASWFEIARVSYFRPFTHDIIAQNINLRHIVYLYRSFSVSRLLGKGEGVARKATKQKGGGAVKNVPQTNSSMYLFL